MKNLKNLTKIEIIFSFGCFVKRAFLFISFLFVFVSLAFVSSVSASSHQIDPDEQIPEKYKEVLEGALTGDVNSQMKLGLLYFSGVGLDKNHNLALQWFEKAADNGHPSAHYMLGKIYLNGIGTMPNIPKAIYHLEKASENGDFSCSGNFGAVIF